jgi:hypothetical protein
MVLRSPDRIQTQKRQREGKSQNAEGKSQNELLHFAFCLLPFDSIRIFPLYLGVSNPDSGFRASGLIRHSDFVIRAFSAFFLDSLSD